ncbi:hypothetical protein KC866_00875 [Patescibacteria group bacterium]|nr:hypothetical protein [Patescibacteria group bacterium]
MRKTFLLLLLCISFIGFSQEKPAHEKIISRVDILANTNNVHTVRYRQTIGGFDFQTMFRIRDFETGEVFIGYIMFIGERAFIVPSIGVRYDPISDNFDELIRCEIRVPFTEGIARFNYGSTNLTSHGVSTSIVFNIMGHFIRGGISSNNEHIGPQLELRFTGGKRWNNIRLSSTYLSNNEFVVGLLISIGGTYTQPLKN